MHCSAPAAPLLLAARNALERNRRHGDALRRRLLSNIELFRSLLGERGIRLQKGVLPVQTIAGLEAGAARRLYRRLMEAGIVSLLHRGHDGAGARLSFIVTVEHSPWQMIEAADVFARLAQGSRMTGEVCM